jgi:transcriptional regulator with XRE-family HTH domain
VDAHVGQRIKLARIGKGISQSALAEAVGVSFQQVQKYERGANRVSAGRLAEFAAILGVGISYFFEESAAEHAPGASPAGKTPTFELTKLDLDILRQLSHIRDIRLKRKFLELIGVLASQPHAPTIENNGC